MKTLSCCLIFCLMFFTGFSAKSQESSGEVKVPLYVYLTEEGEANKCHFTVEDAPERTQFPIDLVSVRIINKRITSTVELIRYLRKELPGVTVSIKYKGVISIIVTSLLHDPNYILNKFIDCDFVGPNLKFSNYLSTKFDNRIGTSHVLRQYGPYYSNDSIYLNIHTRKESVRSILTKYVPLADAEVILWDTVTGDITGYEFTNLHIAGSKM